MILHASRLINLVEVVPANGVVVPPRTRASSSLHTMRTRSLSLILRQRRLPVLVPSSSRTQLQSGWVLLLLTIAFTSLHSVLIPSLSMTLSHSKPVKQNHCHHHHQPVS